MLPLRVLVLKDVGMTLDVDDDLKEWAQYEKDHTGIELQFESRVISVGPLVHESFNVVQISPGVSRDLFGLRGVKDIIRPQVKEGFYDAVIFIYDIKDSEMWKSDQQKALDSIANWTYFSPLYAGTPFTEVVVDEDWGNRDPFRVFSHEIRHNWCYRLRALGYPVIDQMDSSYVLQPDGSYKWIPYFKEYDPYAVDGNRARETMLLQSYFTILLSRPEVKNLIQKIQAALAALIKQITTMPTKDSPGMILWASAIKSREGWAVGTTSYRNLNPGNLRYTAYTKSLGAIGKDASNFCIFASYDAGWGALLQLLRDARANQLVAYRNYAQQHERRICTIADFYHVYAPAEDDNDPASYGAEVAKKIGVPITTPIDQI